MTTTTSPAALQGTLALYTRKPVALPYFDTDASQPHTLVFVPGLTDTLGTLPYLSSLSAVLHTHGFSLVQPQLSANLGGYGQCTLEGDAREIAACIAHLRTTPSKAQGKVVLMGHSTGCQDVIAYLLSCNRVQRGKVDGAVLQAPVSDREFYEMQREAAGEDERKKMDGELHLATQLVHQGKGAALMSREDEIVLPTDPDDAEEPEHGPNEERQGGNTSAVLRPAMTAYRTWSLKAKGGHDDFFSSDLDAGLITNHAPGTRSIGRAIHNLQSASPNAQILALIGENDEYVPPGKAEILLQRWNDLLKDTGGFEAKILPGANHQAASQAATESLLKQVDAFLTQLSRSTGSHQ